MANMAVPGMNKPSFFHTKKASPSMEKNRPSRIFPVSGNRGVRFVLILHGETGGEVCIDITRLQIKSL